MLGESLACCLLHLLGAGLSVWYDPMDDRLSTMLRIQAVSSRYRRRHSDMGSVRDPSSLSDWSGRWYNLRTVRQRVLLSDGFVHRVLGVYLRQSEQEAPRLLVLRPTIYQCATVDEFGHFEVLASHSSRQPQPTTGMQLMHTLKTTSRDWT